MSSRYDSIVIGAGHNGLVCASYLAQGGQNVLVLEAKDCVGGAAITREFAPGFRVSACAHLLHVMPRTIVDELSLLKHGLALGGAALPTTLLSAEGAHVSLLGAGVQGVPTADALAYERFTLRMRKFALHLRPLLETPPPRLGTSNWADSAGLLRMAWQLRSLGRADMRELLRIIGMNVYDLAEEHFVSPLLRSAIAFDAVLGTNAGPRAPGTVLTLLYRMASESGAVAMAQPKGGMGAVAGALAAAARGKGVTIRTGTRVARVVVRRDHACGVILTDGELIECNTVISNTDPRATFLRLLGAEHLDTGFVRTVNRYRDHGLVAKFHLALRARPAFRGLDDNAMQGRLVVAPSLDYIESAYNPSKYGECSVAPVMEIMVPTIGDESMAPQGSHVISAIVQYAPYAPKTGWVNLRDAFTDRIMETLEKYIPDIGRQVVSHELLTPDDIEQEFGMSGGHWHHGELAFDQFFMVRPVPGATQYRTPVAGLYLCGAGSHPGGGIAGIAGRNAARAVLKPEPYERG